MKEYICKEDLFYSGLIKLDISGENWSEVEKLPTVTKSDICKEFVDKVKQMMKMPEYGFCDIERIMEISLTEMEQ